MSNYIVGIVLGVLLGIVFAIFDDKIKWFFRKLSNSFKKQLQPIETLVKLDIEENEIQGASASYKVKKRKIVKIPSDYQDGIIFLYEYFYKIGLIKSEMLVRNGYSSRENFDLQFTYPLYQKICSEYGDVFKNMTYYYLYWFDDRFDELVAQYKFMYNEITKHESLFYLIFKYDVKFNFYKLYSGASVGVEEYKQAFKKIEASVKHNEQDRAIFESIKMEIATHSDVGLRKEKNDFVNSIVEKVIEKPKENVEIIGDKDTKVVNFDPTDDIIQKYIKN